MITIKLFDKHNNLLLKTHKSSEINERVEVSYYKYSTADHYTLTDEEDNIVGEGKVIPVIVL